MKRAPNARTVSAPPSDVNAEQTAMSAVACGPVTRREALGLLAAAGAALTWTCGDNPADPTPATATGVYAAKGQNPTTNTRDNVFSDGVSQEMVALAGDTTTGYTATFQVGIPG